MGEAANGKDAMDQIEKLQPQIVISDVVMPLMDGVDFTVAVHHRYPHIQMIILSGYDNFEYVKQTLMQGVVDYILKPTLTPHELLGVLQKAAARIPGWHPDHAMTGETAEELLKELLLGETKTGEELQKVFAASYYCMYAVTIAHGSERAAETAELLCEKIQRAKSEFSGVLICSLPTGILFLVLQKSFANGIVGAVKGKDDMPDTVGFQDFSEIGNPRFLHLEEISDMEVVNKTTYKRNENKYMLTKKPHCHILKIV
jgi:YesN/AraC family two-component response regulator